MVRLCTALVGRQEGAEDIVQDAFVRVASRIEGLASDATGPYLRQTVINLWRNRLRRVAVEMRHRASLTTTSASDRSPDDRDMLWRSLLKLSDRQRACLVLRYYEDMSEQEIAQALHCSRGAVKSHTSRGLAKLRKELGDGY